MTLEGIVTFINEHIFVAFIITLFITAFLCLSIFFLRLLWIKLEDNKLLKEEEEFDRKFYEERFGNKK